nr:LLM class flavin-dependent oxidoreductase [Kibdelosporangium phytohabitans]
MAPPALGRAVEERGFESLFFPEHTHIPVQSRRADGSAARPYAETYDPFVALSAVAAVTSTLQLGTGVCLVTQRDPIITAKEVACLDRLSDGRFLFGAGAGRNRLELANHGTNARTRMALFAERVQATRRIWTAKEAESTAGTSTSTRSGPGPSRSSDRAAVLRRRTAPPCRRRGPGHDPGHRVQRAAGRPDARHARRRRHRPVPAPVAGRSRVADAHPTRRVGTAHIQVATGHAVISATGSHRLFLRACEALVYGHESRPRLVRVIGKSKTGPVKANPPPYREFAIFRAGPAATPSWSDLKDSLA